MIEIHPASHDVALPSIQLIPFALQLDRGGHKDKSDVYLAPRQVVIVTKEVKRDSDNF